MGGDAWVRNYGKMNYWDYQAKIILDLIKSGRLLYKLDRSVVIEPYVGGPSGSVTGHYFEWFLDGKLIDAESLGFARPLNGGGIDPSITAGIAVGGGMIGSLEQSYKYGNPNVKYAKRVNGKVRTSSVLTRANQMNATKMASGLKVVGRGVTGLSFAVSGYQFLNSDMSGNDYARLSGSLIITGTAFIPIVGPLISIGLGVADSYGAFDGIYNYFD